jgi:predicted phosphodiesterase
MSERIRALVAPFPALPEGITSFDDWKSLEITGPTKALILSDIHVPYHDRDSIMLAVERGADADLVILNGDITDCYEVSHFQPDPRKCNFPEALHTTRELLKWIRSKFPKARIIYKEGNHEERLERYFTVRAPAVLGVEEFELKNLLKLFDLGIEWLGEKRPMRVGKLYVIHGHEFRCVFSNPVNPARGLFLRSKLSAMCGHFHQSSQHSEKDLSGKVVSTWSTGCLCDMRPEYMPLNNWGHGAAIVEIDAKGAYEVENFRIIEGKVY